MKTWLLSLLLLLSGCAMQPRAPLTAAGSLFNDAAFPAPAARVDARGLFDLSPAMRRHLHSARFQQQLRQSGQVQGLLEALYDRRELALDYDSTYTGTAAETYAARKGNCLSLVIMTAAFARELGMQVRFQEVKIAPTWSRDGQLYVVSSHVNLSLAPNARQFDGADPSLTVTVDFIPSLAAGRERVRYLEEGEIVALYMTNRAAEELARGRLADAYWWARAALQKRPSLEAAYNTLGVIYQRSGQPQLAERAYRAALEREPDSLVVMQNLAPLLAANGKAAESQQLAQRIARLYPAPPYHYFHLGMAAYRANDFAGARTLFAREVARAPYNDEFHYWLGVAYLRLGELDQAMKQLAQARDMSTGADARGRYVAKLEKLRAESAAGAATMPRPR